MGEAVAARERFEKYDGARGEAMAAKRLVDTIADVAGVTGEVLVPSEADIDGSGFGVRGFVNDCEETGRDLMDWVRGEICDRETKIGVFEAAGVEGRGDECGRVGHGKRIADAG